MKTNLLDLVNAISDQPEEKGFLGSIGLDNKGNFRVTDCSNGSYDQEYMYIGKLENNGIFDIKEIVYDSSVITEIVAENDKEIEEILNVYYGIRRN